MHKTEHGAPRLEEMFAVADRAADEAGAILLERFGKAKVDYKGQFDLVTDADRAAEQRIVEILRDAFPGHGIVGEESGEQPGESRVRWLVDPIDGTTNYAHGLPLFAVSIAAEVDGELAVGIVYNPVYQEKYTAIRGHGAFLNGRRLAVSDTAELEKSMLMTGFPYPVRSSEESNIDHFINFSNRCRAVRRLGSAALDLAYVARGALDGYWDLYLHPWDLAAGWLLVEEAGGKVTDLRGRPLTYGVRQILATNGKIHDEMLRVLALGKTGLDTP
ncbi:MAG: inositol monophosphatase family protein [Limnochordia bacterium]